MSMACGCFWRVFGLVCRSGQSVDPPLPLSPPVGFCRGEISQARRTKRIFLWVHFINVVFRRVCYKARTLIYNILTTSSHSCACTCYVFMCLLCWDGGRRSENMARRRSGTSSTLDTCEKSAKSTRCLVVKAVSRRLRPNTYSTEKLDTGLACTSRQIANNVIRFVGCVS